MLDFELLDDSVCFVLAGSGCSDCVLFSLDDFAFVLIAEERMFWPPPLSLLLVMTSFANFFLMIFLTIFLFSLELSGPLDDDVVVVVLLLPVFCFKFVAELCLLKGEGVLPLVSVLGLSLLSVTPFLIDLPEALLISEQALGDRSRRCMACSAPFNASMVFISESVPVLGVLDFLGRSVGPTFSADLRKSLLGSLPFNKLELEEVVDDLLAVLTISFLEPMGGLLALRFSEEE